MVPRVKKLWGHANGLIHPWDCPITTRRDEEQSVQEVNLSSNRLALLGLRSATSQNKRLGGIRPARGTKRWSNWEE